MSHKRHVGFTAALALSAGLTVIPPVEAGMAGTVSRTVSSMGAAAAVRSSDEFYEARRKNALDGRGADAAASAEVFQNYLRNKKAINQATAVSPVVARAEGMSKSGVSDLAECQAAYGITPGYRDGVTLQQAWDTVNCAERAGKEKGLFIGLAVIGVALGGCYAVGQRRKRELS